MSNVPNIIETRKTVRANAAFREWTKKKRESLKESLARDRKNIKLYCKVFNLLLKHGLVKEDDFSSYTASEAEIEVELFEQTDGGPIRYSLTNGQLRPALRRTGTGVPVVSLLARHFGARLSKANYSYPHKVSLDDNVFSVQGVMYGSGQYENFRFHFHGLFHNREGQKCQVTEHKSVGDSYLTIVCKKD